MSMISLTHKVIQTHVHIVVIRTKKDLRHDFETLLMTWEYVCNGGIGEHARLYNRYPSQVTHR